ncbi:hypothetical protein HDU91_006290, partial [Kappamyces sp. JEL0680]
TEYIIPTIWVIGGGQIYTQSLPLADYLLLSRVSRADGQQVLCDTHLDLGQQHDFVRIKDHNEFGSGAMFPFDTSHQEGDWTFEFQLWQRSPKSG